MRRVGQVIGALAAVATAALAPVEAAASCNAVVEWPRPGSPEERALHAQQRRDCARVADDRERYLSDVRLGRHEYDEVAGIADNFATGSFGCLKDSAYAFSLLETMLPDPIPLDADWGKLDRAAKVLPSRQGVVSRPRRREIEGFHWLLAPSPVSLATRGWSQAEIDGFLIEPGHWEFALANFGASPTLWQERAGSTRVFYVGRNPEVDAAVFRLLTDPASPRFDPQRAVGLGADSPDPAYRRAAIDLLLGSPSVQRDVPLVRAIAAASNDSTLQLDVARRLLDGRPGAQELDAARALLGWYSPYVHSPEQETRSAAELWQELARHLAAAPDPDRRALGEAVLRTGDPRLSRAALPPEIAGGLAVLDRWPEALPPLDLGPADRWDEYPARALRDELGGLVGVGLLFGPDGGFRQLWVSRSSGSAVLDEAATRALTRYVRPRLAELKLPGFAGRSVLVPLAEVEWHIGATPERPAGAAVNGNRVVVVGEWISRPEDDRVIC